MPTIELNEWELDIVYRMRQAKNDGKVTGLEISFLDGTIALISKREHPKGYKGRKPE